jgi:hypothetical protein
MRALTRLMALTVLAAGVLGAAPPPTRRAPAPGEARDAGEVVTVAGTITEVKRPLATLRADGTITTIHLGPAWYWRQRGYALAVGDRVTVTGPIETEGEAVHLYLHTLTRGGETYVFADEEGVPLWSRSGAGGGSRAGAGPRGGPGPGPGGGGGAHGCCGCCRGECPRAGV